MSKYIIVAVVLAMYWIARIAGLENDEIMLVFIIFNTVYIVSLEERFKNYERKKRRNNGISKGNE